MVKTSDFESENSGSSPGEAAIVERVALAIIEQARLSCYDDRCTCSGYQRWECLTGTNHDDIAKAAVAAVHKPD